MRILFLTQFFQPEPFFKALPFAKELLERGHEVEVLTGFPNYPGGNVYPGYKIRLWQKETMQGVRVNRVALYPSHDKSARKRFLNYASFALSSSLVGPWLVGRPDVIYVYHPPGTIGLPALVLRFLKRSRVVYDIQDLWPDTIASTGMFSGGAAMRLLDRWCRFVYRSADRVVVLSPGFKRVLIERGVSEDRIRVVYNWADVSAEHAEPEAGFEAKFVVLFAGTMGPAQALDTVLEAARLCKDPRVQFVFIGGGVDRDRLESRALEEEMSNVTFLPRRPMEQMPPLLAAANLLLVHLSDDPLFKITIPSKTQAYLASGKPLLMAVGGDAEALVLESGAGFTCRPEDARALVTEVERAASLPVEVLQEMGSRGKRYYDEKLSMNHGVTEMERIFAEVVGKT